MNKKLLRSLVAIVILNNICCCAPESLENKKRIYAKHKATSWWYKPSAYLGYWFYEYPYQLPYDSQNKTFWEVTNNTDYVISMYTNGDITKIYPHSTRQIPHLKSFAFTLTNKNGDTIQYTTSNHFIKIKEDSDTENMYITTKS